MNFENKFKKDFLARYCHSICTITFGSLLAYSSLLLFYHYNIENYVIPYTGLEGLVNIVFTLLGIVVSFGAICLFFMIGEKIAEQFLNVEDSLFRVLMPIILVGLIILGYYYGIKYILDTDQFMVRLIGFAWLCHLHAYLYGAFVCDKVESIKDVLYYSNFWGDKYFTKEEEKWLLTKVCEPLSFKNVLNLYVLTEGGVQKYKNEIINCLEYAYKKKIDIKGVTLEDLIPLGGIDMYHSLKKFEYFKCEDSKEVNSLYLKIFETFARQEKYEEIREVYLDLNQIDPEFAKILPRAIKDELPYLSSLCDSILLDLELRTSLPKKPKVVKI